MITHSTAKKQSGAATLVVVMVLFFVMAMMAAFANRNLVFEQRIASNYYRASVALETAEAGGEWVVAALNGGLIDAQCKPQENGTSSFRDRYLSISSERAISIATPLPPALPPPAPPPTPQPVAACINSEAQAWVCQCPADGVIVMPAPAAATRLQPMFNVRFQPLARAGAVRVRIMACTDLTANCLPDNVAGSNMLAQSDVVFDVALLSALKVPPASALTARGAIDLGVPGIGVHNADPHTQGLLMQAGQTISGQLDRLSSLPGAPAEQAMLKEDPSLSALGQTDVFARYFGMSASTYSRQPSVHAASCAADCAGALQSLIARGADQIWVDGDLRIASNVNLGTAVRPLLIAATGSITLDGPMIIHGLVFAGGDLSWINGTPQPARLGGALISAGSFTGGGNVDISYSPGVLGLLSRQRGSYVRVPGSWTDAE